MPHPLHIIQELVVVPLVDQRPDADGKEGIQQAQTVVPQGRDGVVQHNGTDVGDVGEHGVHIEQVLHGGAEGVHRVEDGGQVHEQQGENIVEILDILEDHEHGGEDEAHSDVENDQTEDREQEQEEFRGKGDPVDGNEQEEDNQGQPEIDQRGYVLGQQEQEAVVFQMEMNIMHMLVIILKSHLLVLK